jgi:hypothetical protein
LGNPDGSENLPEEALSSLLAVQEIGNATGIFNLHGTTIHWIGHDDWRFLQLVTIAGMATDNFFVLLPDSRTFSQIVKSLGHWHDLCKVADSRSSPDGLLTAALSASLSISEDSKDGVASTDYREAYEKAVLHYERLKASSSSRDKDFCTWFEQLLIHQWHTGLLGTDLIRTLCTTHQRVIGKSGLERARPLFDRRVASIVEAADDSVDNCWIAGYFYLAAMLESQHLEALAALNPQWSRRFAAARSGSAVLGAAPALTGRATFAPYETPMSSELLAAALRTLRRLSDQHTRRLRGK